MLNAQIQTRKSIYGKIQIISSGVQSCDLSGQQPPQKLKTKLVIREEHGTTKRSEN